MSFLLSFVNAREILLLITIQLQDNIKQGAIARSPYMSYFLNLRQLTRQLLSIFSKNYYYCRSLLGFITEYYAKNERWVFLG
ncbi:MAG: hypothetical protein QNJ72_24250 [Pleurocapsa sp. MO_226.B13]|nr:hypothetical protein [Pleurocapsa sp. MO_226.B13]